MWVTKESDFSSSSGPRECLQFNRATIRTSETLDVLSGMPCICLNVARVSPGRIADDRRSGLTALATLGRWGRASCSKLFLRREKISEPDICRFCSILIDRYEIWRVGWKIRIEFEEIQVKIKISIYLSRHINLAIFFDILMSNSSFD